MKSSLWYGRRVALALCALASLLAPRAADAQRSQADCAPGWVFANGQCQEPPSGNGGGNMDAACQATARFDYCQASAYIGCQSFGNQYACRLLQLSQTNQNLFQQIMYAQRACLGGNQQGCAYLQQFRGMYY